MNATESNLLQELKRGTIVLSVLSLLDGEKYGYALVQELENNGVIVDQSTLYPLLRRLESQKLLKSDWLVEGKRPRKYYVITDEGKIIRSTLIDEWRGIVKNLEGIIIRSEENEFDR